MKSFLPLFYVLFSSVLVQAWVVVPSNTTKNLNAIGGLSGNLVLGDSGLILADSSFPALPKTSSQSAASSVNFRPQVSGTTHNLYSIVCINTCYVVGDSGTILHQVNNNWVPLSSGTNKALRSVYFHYDLDSGYAVGDSGTIIQMNGSTWNKLNSGVTQNLYSILFQYGAGLAVGAGGTILKTTDGVTWNKVVSGTNQTLYSILVGGTSPIGFAVGAGGTILKTTDKGDTWRPIPSGTSNTLYSIYSNIIVGQGGVMLSTADSGNTWSLVNSGTTQDLHAANLYRAVGASGTILFVNPPANAIKTYSDDFQGLPFTRQLFDPLGRRFQRGSLSNQAFPFIPILSPK